MAQILHVHYADGHHSVDSAGKAPRTLRLPLERIDAGLAFAVLRWQRRHGHVVRAKLTTEQKTQLRECYALMASTRSRTWYNAHRPCLTHAMATQLFSRPVHCELTCTIPFTP